MLERELFYLAGVGADVTLKGEQYFLQSEAQFEVGSGVLAGGGVLEFVG